MEAATALGSASEPQQLLAEGATDLSEYVYYAVPILALVVVGGPRAVRRRTRPRLGAIAGAIGSRL